MRKLVVLACILALLTSAAALAGCGGGGSGSSSATPESVAQAFVKAGTTGDAATAWSLLSKRVQAGQNMASWAKSAVTNSLGDSTIEVGKATITGDTATVSVKLMNGGKELTSVELGLVKEGGVWKVGQPQ
jgi:Domain of unknown function (DUF4878)